MVEWHPAITNLRTRFFEQHLKARENYSKICGNKPRYNESFVLSLAVSKNDMLIQMVDKPNMTPIGQDRETFTFNALLYLNVAVHAQVCRLFCVAYIPSFSLVQLGYPAIRNISVVNQIVSYNVVFATTKTPL